MECNLPGTAVDDVLSLLEFVKLGALPPQQIDGEYGEYPRPILSLIFSFTINIFSNGNFSLMLPLKPKWNLYTKKLDL